MGLSNFPPSAEGALLLPVLVMNTVTWMNFFKNMARSVIQIMISNGIGPNSSNSEEEQEEEMNWENGRERRIWNTQFKTLQRERFNGGRRRTGEDEMNNNGCVVFVVNNMAECCVCLCGFEADEEVSELSCNHYFHKTCLSKWFRNNHITTCPLCRSLH